MKAVILNDTHFGFKNDSCIVLDYFLDFFNEQLFPYLKKNDIKTIFHLGDLFDRRKYVNFKTLYRVRKEFLDPLQEMGIKVHAICGNHDTYYRNTNTINSLHELVGHYSNWSVYSEPTNINLSIGCVALLPWINPENEEQAAKFISETTCSLLLGHLELCGFQSIRGVFIEQGYDPKHFDKFEYVLTGHYHIKSSRDNIHYLGTQYQMGFSDVWEKKGFHVFDFKERTLEFIENPKKLFHTIDYDEDSKEKIDFSYFKDCYVKIFIKNKTKQPLFERYLDKFYEAGVAELAVAEEVSSNPDLVAVDIHKDTLQLLHEEIETIEEKSINKTLLAEIINISYNSALSKEEE
jgi:DNA repair exonuclease SbcCD nuclease subunit